MIVKTLKMTQKHYPDEQEVYLHCKSIFSGRYANLREVKSIIRILNTNRDSLKTLLKKYEHDDIVAVVKKLSNECVFLLPSRAYDRFPELLGTSKEEAERAVSESNAPASEPTTERGSSGSECDDDQMLELEGQCERLQRLLEKNIADWRRAKDQTVPTVNRYG